MNPVTERAWLYMSLAALPVFITFLAEVVNTLKEGKEPMINVWVWALLICNAIYQMLLVYRAFIDGSKERSKTQTTL